MEAVGQELAPLPDWIGWFQAADRCHCAPWEFFDPTDPHQPPRVYWQIAATILSSAEARAHEIESERAKK